MLESFYTLDRATGLNIRIPGEGEAPELSACTIVRKGSRLEFEKKQDALSGWSAFKTSFEPKTAVALNLSGKGILHKRIEQATQINKANFHQILPNGEIDEFYVQQFLGDAATFVSVIRRTEADKWIEEVCGLGFRILTLSLGPFPVAHILTQLNTYEQQLSFDGYRIKWNEQSQWTDFIQDRLATASFSLKAELEPLSEKLLVPYAAAFQLLLAAKRDLVITEHAALNVVYKSTLENRKFRFNSLLVLCTIFVVLLANTFLFTWLGKENAELGAQISRRTRTSSDLKGLQERIAGKAQQLAELGWDDGPKKSVMIDQLGALLPTEVTWTELRVNAVDAARTRADKVLRFRNRQLLVSGTAQRIVPVNEWVARLRTSKWVKDASLQRYTYNSELNTGEFTIIISY
jgi:Tfp pilus assembly protein PilN